MGVISVVYVSLQIYCLYKHAYEVKQFKSVLIVQVDHSEHASKYTDNLFPVI